MMPFATHHSRVCTRNTNPFSQRQQYRPGWQAPACRYRV